MKLLMIPSWYPTEEAPLLGTFYQEQAEALAARGVEVAVLYANVGSDFHPAHNGIRHANIRGVNTYTYTHPNWTPRWEKGRCRQRTRMLEKLYRRLEAEWGRPDVVNLRSSLQGYEALALCRRHRLPLFFMEHSSYVLTEGPGSPAHQRLREVMAEAKVSAAVSNALCKAMEPYGETRVIPDIVDTDRFFIRETEPHDGFVFRAMGQLRPIKGYDTLIRAFARLRGMVEQPVRLEIAGSGGLHESLEALIQELGVADICSLVGTIPRAEAPLYMNGCDCFVCSSRTETLSCVLNESAACGKPVIATMCGGPQDIVTPETGLLTPVDDVEAMADTMRTMMETVTSYDPQRIRTLTIERFGVEVVCQKLIQACADTVR